MSTHAETMTAVFLSLLTAAIGVAQITHQIEHLIVWQHHLLALASGCVGGVFLLRSANLRNWVDRLMVVFISGLWGGMFGPIMAVYVSLVVTGLGPTTQS